MTEQPVDNNQIEGRKYQKTLAFAFPVSPEDAGYLTESREGDIITLFTYRNPDMLKHLSEFQKFSQNSKLNPNAYYPSQGHLMIEILSAQPAEDLIPNIKRNAADPNVYMCKIVASQQIKEIDDLLYSVGEEDPDCDPLNTTFYIHIASDPIIDQVRTSGSYWVEIINPSSGYR